MATTSSRAAGLNMAALTDFSSLTPKGKAHLKNVYTSLAMTMLAASVGAYVNIFTASFLTGNGFLTLIGTFGCLMGLSATRGPARAERLGMLLGFGFFSGVSAGPLIEAVAMINPTIPMTAFLYTSVIFGCFTMAALKAPSRSYLYLGGVLGSGLMMLLTMSLLNIFMGSHLVFQAQVYMGLLVFCGFIIYDTQLIVEKHRQGDNDYIWHSVDLFIDFIAVFKRIMIILAQNSKEKKKSNSRRR